LLKLGVYSSQWFLIAVMAILPSENPRIVKYLTREKSIPHESQVCGAKRSHECHSWGIDFSLVRYFTILGFSDGRIVAFSTNFTMFIYFRNNESKIVWVFRAEENSFIPLLVLSWNEQQSR
jgi:hypothetical protein